MRNPRAARWPRDLAVLAVSAGRAFNFSWGGAQRRVSGVRPWMCGMHVIEGTCQDRHGGFGSYRFSLTGIDVELPLRMAAANRASGGEADLQGRGRSTAVVGHINPDERCDDLGRNARWGYLSIASSVCWSAVGGTRKRPE